MAKDFKASQVRTTQIIASGSTANKPSLLIASASSPGVNFDGGGISNATLLDKVGKDVFVFVSGTKGSKGTTVQGVTLFGGDIVISGTAYDGSGSPIGGGSPGGSDTYVQFNDGGTTFGGDSGLTYNKTTDTLTAGNVQVTDNTTLGNASSDSVTANAKVWALSDLNVSGNVKLGDSTTDSLQVTANSWFDNSLNVSGSVTLGYTYLNSVTANAKVWALSDLNVSGSTEIAQNLTVAGNLKVNGTVTTVNTTNLVVKDPIIYFGSSSAAGETTGGIALASGSSFPNEAMVFGKVATNTWGAGRFDVQAGSALSMTAMEPIALRVAKLELGNSNSFLTASSNTLIVDSADIYISSSAEFEREKALSFREGAFIQFTSDSSGQASITLGSSAPGALAISNASYPGQTSVRQGIVHFDGVDIGASFFVISGSSEAFGTTTFDFDVRKDNGNLRSLDTSDVNFFVTGAIGSKDTSTRGTAVFGGDVVISGTAYDGNGNPLGGGNPGGSNTHIQFNDSGSFGGDAGLTYDKNLGSFEQGNGVQASGNYSHAEGYGAQTVGSYSHAEGYTSITTGSYSHAEGYFTTAVGNGAHTEGSFTVALGNNSHAEGADTVSSGVSSHAEGTYTTAVGDYSHAEGSYTQASGSYSHAEGFHTIGSGVGSHAEGFYSVASGDYAHSVGINTLAFGSGSYASGYYTTASGDYSSVAGYHTFASGTYSYAGGYYTIASGSGQTVVGKYNKRGNTDSLFVVGGGTGDSDAGRKDILLVNQNTVSIGSASLGSDVVFYVSGNANNSNDTTKTVIGGSLVVSGAIAGGYNPFISLNLLEVSSSLIAIRGNPVGIEAAATDTFLYVSGAVGSKGTSTRGVSVFGGDVVVSGNLHAASISGSLTKLTDGTSYLIAGTNVTITTGSNGAVTIASTGGGGDSFFSSTTGGSIFTTGSAAFRGAESSVDSPSDKGSDVVFYVSGSTLLGGGPTATKGALFGGDLLVSGTLIGRATAGGQDNLLVTEADKVAIVSINGDGSPAFGSDIYMFVSGSTTSKDTSQKGTVLFGGDVVTSGTIYPGTDLGANLGSATNRWNNIYTGDLHLKNDRGDYTLIEEEDCLTIRFNKTGKRYRFVLECAPEYDEK